MNFVIMYFSGTGNTQLISEEIQQCLKKQRHQVELISIEALDSIKTLNLKGKMLGFDEIRNQWRRDVLRYWFTHRRWL